METNPAGTITLENTTSVDLDFILTDSKGSEILLARLQAGKATVIDPGNVVLNNRLKIRQATLSGDIATTTGDSRITRSPNIT